MYYWYCLQPSFPLRSDDFEPTMLELRILFLKACFLQQVGTQCKPCHHSHILYVVVDNSFESDPENKGLAEEFSIPIMTERTRIEMADKGRENDTTLCFFLIQ